MWFETFRQFLDRSLQRFADWVRSVEILQPYLVRWGSATLGANLPALEGLGPCEVHFSIDAQDGRRHADLSYRYRSLHCQIRVSSLETTPGLQYIYEALQASEED